MNRVRATLAAAALVVTGCAAPEPAPDAGPSPAVSRSAGAVASSATAVPGTAAPAGTASAGAATTAVLVGAGDIATCDSTADSRTAALVERTPGTVFTLGDNAYPDGGRGDFRRCYAPTWGRFADRTRPTVGNHEYHTAGAAAYFDYFGAAAGPRGKGYYSYDLGSWHVVVLNTNCTNVPGGCATGSPQQRWLRADLAASRARCTVAMVHAPLFTSARVHPPATETRPLVQTLYDAGVEVLLAGHNHMYERFAPQTPAGRRDTARGIRAFVVGTGGAGLYPVGTIAPNSEVRDSRTFGVLRLQLSADMYRWAFLPTAGTFNDGGTGTCH